MAGTTDIGRAPSACLRRERKLKVEHGRQDLKPVVMIGADWDTDPDRQPHQWLSRPGRQGRSDRHGPVQGPLGD
jgi:hypothetical protein